ncbi:sodium:solute symporter family transporter [Leucobacter chromiireducens]|uniref:Sodium:solute symporter n=1 Tax=Leucobacter chromiireducens subsp. chromiireducens TaxID=660067 RepID=A0ABS1SRB2_9MICO|nr:sodium:solute symporter [Leucobacter chromiireducens subsp. chromiireducens]
MVLDYIVIAAYLIGILGVGYWGMRRSKSKSDYLVAGRRLGGFMYSGAMSAIVLGGASTVGGIGLGWEYGISGAWLVTAIGLGILLLSAFLAKRIVKLKVTTVTEMLDLRYGGSNGLISGIVMFLYTLMLTVTSTLAYATIFHVLFGISNLWGVIIGGSIVAVYSIMGGMWSITMTDVVQFVIKTIGMFLLLLPIALISASEEAGGWDGIRERLGDSFFSPWSIGGMTIVTYIIVYTLGLLIGQDIWQRVVTARTPRVAKWGGITSGVYCLLYAFAGALIGMAARVLFPEMDNRNDAFAFMAQEMLPPGVRGIVLAAALSAMMSTASGALIASATVFTTDLFPAIRRLFGMKSQQVEVHDGHVGGESLTGYRVTIFVLAGITMFISTLVTDVVAALTIAYDILVGGLLVAIVGGLFWKRGTRAGALASMLVGAAVVIVSMSIWGILANEPIYFSLLASLVTYVVVSLLTKPTPAPIIDEWTHRLSLDDRTAVNDVVYDEVQR